MHPRGLRCSSFKYSRYSQSSRLARGAPRPSRCDAGLSPRAASRAALNLGPSFHAHGLVHISCRNRSASPVIEVEGEMKYTILLYETETDFKARRDEPRNEAYW